eukprot:1156736-Pelagomonas_calceolata.AAC.4
MSWNPSRPPLAHGTAPDGSGSFSTLMFMQLQSLRPGRRPGKIAPTDGSSLQMVHRISLIITAMSSAIQA